MKIRLILCAVLTFALTACYPVSTLPADVPVGAAKSVVEKESEKSPEEEFTNWLEAEHITPYAFGDWGEASNGSFTDGKWHDVKLRITKVTTESENEDYIENVIAYNNSNIEGRLTPMEQAIINVEGTSTIETAAAAKKLIETFGSQNIRAISVKRVNENSNEVVVELDFVPGLAQHLHGFTMQVNGLTAGYDGTGPSNLYEVLQAAGVSETLVTREDITQKDAKTIPLHLEREVKQYGELQYA